MKTLWAAVVGALALALLGASESRSAQPTQSQKPPAAVLGVSYRSYGTSTVSTLAWFDPLTLEKLPGRRAPLGVGHGGWAFSHDRSTLAIGTCGDTWKPRLRFVNARVMRVLGDLRLPTGYECVRAVSWVEPDRVLAVIERSAATAAVVIDPVTRRLVRSTELPKNLWTTAAAGDALVLLFGGRDAFVPALIAVVDADGRVRTVSAEGIRIGSVVDYSTDVPNARTISPGFAVDPDGRRAFLVPADGSIAEIDLVTLQVEYHELDRPSAIGRFLRWLEPSADAKLMQGPVREARWLGDSLLAISGSDYSYKKNAAGDYVMSQKPVGVKLVDTRLWRSRMLSRGSSGIAVAPGLLLAQGGEWDAQRERTVSPGILAFGLDGEMRWKLASTSWLDPVGNLGIGYLWRNESRMDVVDLGSGQIVRSLDRSTTAAPWPQLLARQSSGW